MRSLATLSLALIVASMSLNAGNHAPEEVALVEEKPVIYQVFTRLFGNQNTTNKPWGTIEENGVGKFNDFTDTALAELKAMGYTHIWYTGVPHHGVIRDYTEYGISNDDPDVYKGRAGSPYAVKDYYNVNPDLAVDPAKRLEEFEALIARTHKHGMKVMIDIVPNHVARGYEGLTNPEGVEDFGASDDTSVEYARDNNFYYIPGQPFEVPDIPEELTPLGGEPNPLVDGKFDENPAKWTGNGARKTKPDAGDWYETVKINYGVRPDGTHDFDSLPEGYGEKDYKAHYEFWKDKDVPDSWKKFRDITLYWIEKGVDGFRYDMAEMVPYEFWSYLNSSIKMKNPDSLLLAEIYNPSIYRDYIHKGKMDYLYDKVDLYDNLKWIIQGTSETVRIAEIQDQFADIEHELLHFLENHDEQRIASPDFAGDAFRGIPMMVVSTTVSSAPIMMYFGQDVGEDGSEEPGFGDPTRTSIFDYVGVPAHQRWMNGGKFDGGALTEDEKELHAFYRKILNMCHTEKALRGAYQEVHRYNLEKNDSYDSDLYSYVRWGGGEHLLIIVNFSADKTIDTKIKLPKDLVHRMGLPEGEHELFDLMSDQDMGALKVEGGAKTMVKVAPNSALILKF
jgi:glycosidase